MIKVTDIEPGVVDESITAFQGENPTQSALLSIAVSLKRIADAQTDPNEYGEIGANQIYGALKRGLREAS